MAALFAIIDAERVAFENFAPARIGIEFLKRFAAAVFGALDIDGAFVAVILPRIIFSPHRRIDGIFGDLHHFENVLFRFFFALRNVFHFMATCAVYSLFVIAGMHGDLTDEFTVTVQAIVLQNFGGAFTHANRLVEILQGKTFGMPETVFC